MLRGPVVVLPIAAASCSDTDKVGATSIGFFALLVLKLERIVVVRLFALDPLGASSLSAGAAVERVGRFRGVCRRLVMVVVVVMRMMGMELRAAGRAQPAGHGA